MQDNNFLLSFTKDFPKETNLIRNIVTLTNDIKSLSNYFRSVYDTENRETEVLIKSSFSISKLFNYEVISQGIVNEEHSNFLNIIQYFLLIDDKTQSQLTDDYMLLSNLMSIEFNKLPILIPNYNDILALFKEYLILRNKQKSNTARLTKIMKDLSLNIIERRKEKEKSTYNTAIKIKIDEKICKILTEYYEANSVYISTADEIKNIENTINEFLSRLIMMSSNEIENTFEKLNNSLTIIFDGKLTQFNNQIKVLKENIDLITKLNIIDSEKIIESYAKTKQIKHYDINTINFESQFNKNNFSTTFIFDILSNHFTIYTQLIINKKKILLLFSKYLKDKIKNIDLFLSQWTKIISKLNIVNFKSNLQHKFITQVFDMYRAIDEMILKKLNDVNKYYNQVSNILENQLKDLSIEESYISSLNKFNKESSLLKESIAKNSSSIEKLQLNIINIKEDIVKNCEDPSNFTKFENKLHQMRVEENNLKEEKEQLFKKSLKFLEENYTQIKHITNKGFQLYKEKNNEIKDCLIGMINFHVKAFEDVKEYIIIFNNQYSSCKFYKKDMIEIFLSKEYFEKEYVLSINQNNLDTVNSYLSNLFHIEFNSLELPEINTINFINDLSISKNFNILSDSEDSIITKDEYDEYDQMLKSKDGNSTNQIKKYDGIFYIDGDETINNSFNCALSEKILLQGKLYLTSKKFVFYSWFNGSTLFGKTLIEIPNSDIIDISKKKNLLFDNSIMVKTKLNDFYFTSFINRGDCFNAMSNILGINNTEKEVILSPEQNKVVIENNSQEEITISNSAQKSQKIISFDDMTEFIKESSKVNSKAVSKANSNVNSKPLSKENSPEKNNKNITIQNNEVISNIQPIQINSSSLKEILDKYKLIENIKYVTKENLKYFYDKNPRKPVENFLLRHKLNHLPLNLIFNCLYNPEKANKSLKFNKNFWMSYKLFINNKTIDETYNKDEFKIPSYYKSTDLTNQNIFLSKHPNEELISNFVNLIKSEIDPSISNENKEYKSSYQQVNYFSNHPIPNPKFMAPKNLDVKEEIKIYFISPTCFIADHLINLSGFMMMDTFYVIKSFRFETDISFHDNKIKFDTYISCDFILEFTKTTYFKDKIAKESTASNKDTIKNELLIKFQEALSDAEREYENLKNYCMIEHQRLDINNENQEVPRVELISNNEIKEILSGEAMEELPSDIIQSKKSIISMIPEDTNEIIPEEVVVTRKKSSVINVKSKNDFQILFIIGIVMLILSIAIDSTKLTNFLLSLNIILSTLIYKEVKEDR